MSEAELWELQGQWTAFGGEIMIAWITVMFAFLIMSHYVGANLSRFQVLIASGLFVWASLLMTYGAAGYYYRSFMFADLLKEINPDLVFFLDPLVVTGLALMMVVGTVVGLLFLHSVRKNTV
jgi:hypothetical protein